MIIEFMYDFTEAIMQEINLIFRTYVFMIQGG